MAAGSGERTKRESNERENAAPVSTTRVRLLAGTAGRLLQLAEYLIMLGKSAGRFLVPDLFAVDMHIKNATVAFDEG